MRDEFDQHRRDMRSAARFASFMALCYYGLYAFIAWQAFSIAWSVLRKQGLA